MKTKTILKLGEFKVIEHTYTKGINIGDYYYTVTQMGQFVERFGNRMANAAINLCKELADKKSTKLK